MSERLSCRDVAQCRQLAEQDPAYHKFLVDCDHATRRNMIAKDLLRTPEIQRQRAEEARQKSDKTLRLTPDDRMQAVRHMTEYYQNPALFESQPFQCEPPPEYCL